MSKPLLFFTRATWVSTRSNVVCRSCLNVPISGTKELASRTTGIVWRTRSDTFVLCSCLPLTTPPNRIPCGTNYVCTTHDYMLAVLSICKANSSIETDTRCCSTPCRFILGITLVCENVLSPCFFDCLFIDSFCDLCPTRHHKRSASHDHSQQNSSIALLLSPCFRGTSDESNDVAEGVKPSGRGRPALVFHRSFYP